MRVATWNVLNARSTSDGRVDLERFRGAVASLDADVLALQEVDRHQERSLGADLTAIAADAMGAVAHRFVPTLVGSPEEWVPAGDADALSAPAYGVALLSRRRVTTWRAISLPRVTVPAPVRHRDDLLPSLVREEPRVAVVARVEGPSGPVTVVNAHLSFVPWWNGHQLRTLVRTLRNRAEAPHLLMGDLNMGAQRARRVTGMTSLVSERTFPAHAPTVQLDHVLADRAPRVLAAEARWLPVSDHRALVVDLG
jgi:endonuclease/exonuclease/phosphatase family metal-dependent hydrolase